jgi:menaquinone-dependent protoporphyrinogen oxidase
VLSWLTKEDIMPKALIVHASKHGATAGIAERIGEVLRAEKVDAVVAPAALAPDPHGFDAVVVGAGVYMGSWVKDGVTYLEDHRPTLAAMPVWLFSSGPLPNSTKERDGDDPITHALGPTEGPGSAGRRRVEALAEAIHVRGHEVFQGAFDPQDPPKSLGERVVRLMPAAKNILPAGDFRQWDRIEAWAREIATAVREPVPVA